MTDIYNYGIVGVPSTIGNSDIVSNYKFNATDSSNDETINAEKKALAGNFLAYSSNGGVEAATADGVEYAGIATAWSASVHEQNIQVTSAGLDIPVPYLGVFAVGDPVTVNTTGVVDKAGTNATDYVVVGVDKKAYRNTIDDVVDVILIKRY